jgi:antitoxin (DNA-binding transcriptional repressor) of toxin-antitoxin stability system
MTGVHWGYTLRINIFNMMTTKFIGVKDLRQNMAKITKDALKKNERIVVLRNTQPIFELRPISSEDIYKESFIKDIKEAISDKKAGRVKSQAQVEKMFGL